ncbi:polysaccharide biosynthesis protein [Thermodesulfobacteriota bacterium]
MIAADIILISISYYFSYYIRFEANLDHQEIRNVTKTILPIIICKLMVFYFFNLYQGMWRYTSMIDLINVIKAVFTSSLIIVTAILMLTRFHGISRSVYIIDAILTLILIGGSRVSIRLILSKSATELLSSTNNKSSNKNLIIIGAGDAGEKVVREINDNSMMKYNIVAFVDDDKNKVGKHIHGINVLGGIDELNDIISKTKVDEILIAIPAASGKEMRKIIEICDSTKIPYKTLPGLGEIINGKISIKTIRDISYKDLLGRQSVHLENDKILELLKNKCVLVTGAGGSIGSELCRQICKFKPSHLILFDSSESNLYSIQMELEHIIKYIKYHAVLGRVQDKKLVNIILKKFRPNVIFHAAAYKHVPLIEQNPWEAVFSNILGTFVLSEAAIAHKVDRFVLVSTDKAVRPTNVMGASKRIAEKIIRAHSNGSTKFVAVRFGNVIGSSGSVIPLFRQQIEKGGPVTVTHPDITRFFMTIEEASQLILQAFTMGQGGEIFILEMGIPIKILDMAKDLIRLSGKEPDKDVEIIFTGIRPGEKLYEELITEGEGIVPTDHNKILVLRDENYRNNIDNQNLTNNINDLEDKIRELVEASNRHDAKMIKCKLKELVPEYTMSDDECVL